MSDKLQLVVKFTQMSDKLQLVVKFTYIQARYYPLRRTLGFPNLVDKLKLVEHHKLKLVEH